MDPLWSGGVARNGYVYVKKYPRRPGDDLNTVRGSRAFSRSYRDLSKTSRSSVRSTPGMK